MNPFRSPRAGVRRTPLAAIPSTTGEGTVSIRLYEPIDSWGGDWGVSAREFTEALDALPAGTTEIRLLINSPGGEVWDGLAILNALRAHSARVVAVVEGIAASAASFIAAGADELIMMRNSELMIHNAWGIAMGDAEELRLAADDLDRHDRNIAAIYAEKSGRDLEYWLGEMAKDRFLTAEEAVADGLADRIEGDGDAPSARARFDLSVFARGGRMRPAAASLTDKLPDSTEPGDPNRKETVVADDDLRAAVAQRLGVTDAEVTDEQLVEALDEALAENADPAPVDREKVDADEVTVPEGSVLVDAQAFAELKQQAALGAQAHAKQEAERREGIVARAIAEGRVAASARATWLDLLEKDEASATKALNAFPMNTVPVAEIGHSTGEKSADDRLAAKAGWGVTEKKGA